MELLQNIIPENFFALQGGDIKVVKTTRNIDLFEDFFDICGSSYILEAAPYVPRA